MVHVSLRLISSYSRGAVLFPGKVRPSEGQASDFRKPSQKERRLPSDDIQELQLALIRDIEPNHDARPAPA